MKQFNLESCNDLLTATPPPKTPDIRTLAQLTQQNVWCFFSTWFSLCSYVSCHLPKLSKVSPAPTLKTQNLSLYRHVVGRDNQEFRKRAATRTCLQHLLSS
ncbi:hypothetical protein CEXT_390761 [Caerostris extrusa]|uniref:Uncharacterized protein n=1 Tax=Caerostris extrusa TaxID=172846 RepID=A0AAV4WAK6_CAEEX|nr:hypothetical protein CEXT_390761 [Caerostris extrusa]